MDLHSSAGLAIAAAIAGGLCGGFAFFAIWRRVVPRAFSRRFWNTLPADMQGMLRSEDPAAMLVHYKALLMSLASFSARNTLGLVLGLLPMALLFVAVTAYDPSSALATETEVHPPSVDPGGVPPGSRRRDERLLIDRADNAVPPIRVGGLSLDAAMLDRKLAICSSAFGCLLPGMLLFDTQTLPPAQTARGMVLVRPRWFDANPFWPYLNDLDLLFFVAAMLGSAGGAWAVGRSGGVRP